MLSNLEIKLNISNIYWIVLKVIKINWKENKLKIFKLWLLQFEYMCPIFLLLSECDSGLITEIICFSDEFELIDWLLSMVSISSDESEGKVEEIVDL